MLPGDHLKSSRLLYSHHGIYLGNDQVIHYSGFAREKSSGAIEITSLSDFCQGNKAEVVPHRNRRWTAEETIQRAFERLGEDWYNLLLNNCEHFVHWCIEGEHKSPQVNRAVNWSVNAVTATAHRSYPTLPQTVLEKLGVPIIADTTAKRTTTVALSNVVANGLASNVACTATKAATTVAFAAGSGASASLAVATTVGLVSAPISVPVIAVASTFFLVGAVISFFD